MKWIGAPVLFLLCGCSAQVAPPEPAPKVIVVVATPTPGPAPASAPLPAAPAAAPAAPSLVAPSAPPASSSATSAQALSGPQDVEWATVNGPVAVDAARAEKEYLDSTASERGGTQGLERYKAALMQCRSKLYAGPRSPNYEKVHQLLLSGINTNIRGIDKALLGIRFKETDVGQKAIKEGFDLMLEGSNIMQDVKKALDEVVEQLKPR